MGVPGVVLLAALGVLEVSGCGKKTEARAVAPAVVPETQAAPAAAAPTAQAGQGVSPLVQANGQVDMPELQRTVLRWILANRRRPANFEDFAATAGVQIPPAPAGKKYVLMKDLHVRLVDR